MNRLAPLLVLLAACGGPAETPASSAPAPAAAPVPLPPDEAALSAARAAAKRLGETLKGRLQAALAEGGPVAAVQVCNTDAPRLAAEIAAETGVTVGRSSLRLRNPANTAPEAVSRWLQEQGEREAEGVVGVDRVEGGQALVIRPIAVEAVCLSCHGAPDQLAPELREALAQRYPTDQATGYSVGDLRGALWAVAPLGTPAP